MASGVPNAGLGDSGAFATIVLVKSCKGDLS